MNWLAIGLIGVMAMGGAQAQLVRVYAAGSLRAPLTMIRRRSCLVLLAGLGASLAVQGQTLARPSEVVYVHGSAMRSHHVLSPQDLMAQPAETIGAFTQTRSSQGAESRTSIRGVRLAPLAERLGLKPAARNDWKNLMVTVTATDGYRAQFSWAELVNTGVGEGVLVVFERDGKPLDRREGLIALYSTQDFRLGARHVRNALRIEVRSVSD